MALPSSRSAPYTAAACSGCHCAAGERCAIALIFGSSRLTGTSSGAPENDRSNVLSCSTASVARSVMSLSSRFQSASSRSRSRSGDKAMAGSRATNTDAVPIGVLAEVRQNRPMNWIIGPRLFFTSCTAAILSWGRSNPSPSMSTQMTIRQLRSASAANAASRFFSPRRRGRRAARTPVPGRRKARRVRPRAGCCARGPSGCGHTRPPGRRAAVRSPGRPGPRPRLPGSARPGSRSG